ncbi:MAG: acetyl-CoA C-acyltransferase [Salinisphaeraceae bacterium]
MTQPATNDPVVIAGMARTPMGGLMGSLSTLSAGELGAAAIRAAVERAGLDAAQVQEVIMGNVLSAGQGQAPARQASLGAGLPQGAGCTTVNMMCGSGMKAMMLAHDLLRAGSAEVMVAGGMESMSNAPYLLAKARGGYRLGHGEIKDHMFLDGLEDAYDRGRLMGSFAENCADKYAFSREAQDAFAVSSLERARRASESGDFDAELIPVEITTRKGSHTVDRDEQPFATNTDKIPGLKPAFKPDGTITAANASSISDGAAAVVMVRESRARALGLTPLARIVGHASHAHEPGWFTTAPVGAMRKLFDATGWSAGDVGLYEINEAFAVVTMAAMQEFDLPADRVNVNGGACALGHPIGASGTRIVVTLLAAMAARGVDRGMASLCIGGGEATALAVERL